MLLLISGEKDRCGQSARAFTKSSDDYDISNGNDKSVARFRLRERNEALLKARKNRDSFNASCSAPSSATPSALNALRPRFPRPRIPQARD